jgi:hypothetical protein
MTNDLKLEIKNKRKYKIPKAAWLTENRVILLQVQILKMQISTLNK